MASTTKSSTPSAKVKTLFDRWKTGERLGGLVKESGLERYHLAKTFGELTGKGMAGFYELRKKGAGGNTVEHTRAAKTAAKTVTSKKTKGVVAVTVSSADSDESPEEM